MKKFLSALLAIAMIAAMAPVAFAASLVEGNVYIKEDDDSDYYDYDITVLAPGETAYVYLGEYIRGDDQYGEEPRSISIEEQEIYDTESSDEVKKMISVSSKGEKKKIDDGEYGWFAKIKAKSVSMSSYPEDGYEVAMLTLEFTWDDGTDEEGFEVNLDMIGYEEADEEFEDDVKMFIYDKDDDVEIDLPDEDGVYTGVARKDFEVLASMDTKVNNSLINKYPNADFRFYNGNGANFPVSKGRLTIYGTSDEYCYEVNSSGEYVDLTDTYSSKDKGFVISTTKLGKYIVSDIPLSGAVSAETTTAPSTSTTVSGTTSTSTTYPVTSPIISNPNTGVWEG